MDAFPGSTIAALCYTRETDVGFEQLATDLSRAVAETDEVRLEMPAGDLALCDAAGLRIGLAQVALNRTFPGSLTGRHYPTCMVLSVGPGETVPERPMKARYARVHSDLVARVQDIAAADRILLFERAGAYDPDLHDIVVDDIRGHLDKLLNPRRAPVADLVQTPLAVAGAEPVAAVPVATAPEEPSQAPRAVDVSPPEEIIQDLARRLETELDRLEEARRAFEQAGAAADTQRTPAPHGLRLVVPRLIPGLPSSTLGLFRMPANSGRGNEAYPDYEHMPANVDERPLLHRAAVNALNVTVMTIALPVGAALLTMSVLGREDMLFSSRVTAVTGVGVGLYNTGVVERIFNLFS